MSDFLFGLAMIGLLSGVFCLIYIAPLLLIVLGDWLANRGR